MTNHYHLLVETPEGNLSIGMRQLNGVYTQRFKRAHDRVGHVFQGRYKAILVQKDAYLLELGRYVVLNPVRARMVKSPQAWSWSNYQSVIGRAEPPAWLETDWLLAQFGRRRNQAIEKYKDFVREGLSKPGPWEQLNHQMFLGDEAFVSKFRDCCDPDELSEIPMTQRRTIAKTLDEFRLATTDRNDAMAQAYLSGAYTMKAIGEHFGVHYMTVSRAVRAYENRNAKE